MKMSEKEVDTSNELRVLSLFSGCGGMDLGFEGDFICHRKSISPQSTWFKRLSMNTGFVYRGIVFGRSLRMIY